jgi:hypothetical protein
VISLYFLIVFSISPAQKIESLVIGVSTTLEECATKKRKAEHDFEDRLRANPTEKIECLQLMGTV